MMKRPPLAEHLVQRSLNVKLRSVALYLGRVEEGHIAAALAQIAENAADRPNREWPPWMKPDYWRVVIEPDLTDHHAGDFHLVVEPKTAIERLADLVR